jgi:FSR family fosmidomycin resistance protein-like MFS transporter
MDINNSKVKITTASETKILIILSLAHFTNDGLVLLLPIMLPLIAKDLNLSYIEIGVLGGSILISHGIGQFLAGYYSDKIKRKAIL